MTTRAHCKTASRSSTGRRERAQRGGLRDGQADGARVDACTRTKLFSGWSASALGSSSIDLFYCGCVCRAVRSWTTHVRSRGQRSMREEEGLACIPGVQQARCARQLVTQTDVDKLARGYTAAQSERAGPLAFGTRRGGARDQRTGSRPLPRQVSRSGPSASQCRGSACVAISSRVCVCVRA